MQHHSRPVCSMTRIICWQFALRRLSHAGSLLCDLILCAVCSVKRSCTVSLLPTLRDKIDHGLSVCFVTIFSSVSLLLVKVHAWPLCFVNSECPMTVRSHQLLTERQAEFFVKIVLNPAHFVATPNGANTLQLVVFVFNKPTI